MRNRLRRTVRVWLYRREFKRVLRSWGVAYPTKREVDFALDLEQDKGWMR
jgi:hypothetical protein